MSGETAGPWMGMVTHIGLCWCKRSAILLTNRDFPIPERVELTTLTCELQVER